MSAGLTKLKLGMQEFQFIKFKFCDYCFELWKSFDLSTENYPQAKRTQLKLKNYKQNFVLIVMKLENGAVESL